MKSYKKKVSKLLILLTSYKVTKVTIYYKRYIYIYI